MKDQVREYIDRGDALEHCSYLHYFLDTYDAPPSRRRRRSTGVGRPLNKRIPYREGSNRQSHCRIVRSPGHETMPYFPGQWFPKKDDENTNGLFEASMLALLKPWRSLLDLKSSHETFRDAFDAFVAHAPAEITRIIKNIQFYHECSDSAREHTSTVQIYDEPSEHTTWTDIGNLMEGPSDDSATLEPNDEIDYDNLISEEDIDHVLDHPYSAREQLFAETALAVGLDAHALPEECDSSATYASPALPATVDQLNQFRTWDAMLTKQAEENEPIPSEDVQHSDFTHLDNLHESPVEDDEAKAFTLRPETPTDAPALTFLNEWQSMVHRIICNHLRAHLAQKNPPQI
jgi:hypothetical protein